MAYCDMVPTIQPIFLSHQLFEYIPQFICVEVVFFQCVSLALPPVKNEYVTTERKNVVRTTKKVIDFLQKIIVGDDKG